MSLEWLGTLGGPSILIARKMIVLWSGTGSIQAAKHGNYEEVDDFLDPTQCHYGKACEIKRAIGLIDAPEFEEKVIVIGDEPALTTIIGNSTKDETLIVKWDYGDSEEEFETFLNHDELMNLEGWKKEFTIELFSWKYCLVDSTVSGFDLKYQQVIEIEILPGSYEVYTLSYQPNERTSMLLHKIIRR